MESCPKCHGEGCVKDEIVKGRQRTAAKTEVIGTPVTERGADAAIRRQRWTNCKATSDIKILPLGNRRTQADGC